MASEHLHDTYHAALQHNHVSPDDDDLVLGVVREEMYGIQSFLDENWEELAPPRELLDEFKEVAAEHGHNEAVEIVDFRSRYRTHLEGTTQQAKIADIISELRSSRGVWIVCYENTDEKFCHRDLLREEILEQLTS